MREILKNDCVVLMQNFLPATSLKHNKTRKSCQNHWAGRKFSEEKIFISRTGLLTVNFDDGRGCHSFSSARPLLNTFVCVCLWEMQFLIEYWPQSRGPDKFLPTFHFIIIVMRQIFDQHNIKHDYNVECVVYLTLKNNRRTMGFNPQFQSSARIHYKFLFNLPLISMFWFRSLDGQESKKWKSDKKQETSIVFWILCFICSGWCITFAF